MQVPLRTGVPGGVGVPPVLPPGQQGPVTMFRPQYPGLAQSQLPLHQFPQQLQSMGSGLRPASPQVQSRLPEGHLMPSRSPGGPVPTNFVTDPHHKQPGPIVQQQQPFGLSSQQHFQPHGPPISSQPSRHH